MSSEAESGEAPRRSRPCLLDDRRQVRGVPPWPYRLYTPWPSQQCQPLEPDADGPECVSVAVGSLARPCGGGLATVVVTLYRSYPGPDVDAAFIDGRWVSVELDEPA